LTHFDLACFGWNPIKSILIKRNRAIQDKCEAQWDHLPPEAYEPLYDSLQVDVWSIGTLFVFCLTGAMPFSSPLTSAEAADQWTAFKKDRPKVFAQSMSPITNILNDIFVEADKRLKAGDLVAKLSTPLLSKGNQAEPMRRRSADTTRASKSRQKMAKSNDGLKRSRQSKK